MTRIVRSLAQLSAGYDALFCDLWGCVHDGVRAFPQAVAALAEFRAKGGRVVLLTNAPRPAAAVAASFPSLGLPSDCWDLLVTSGDACRAALLQGCVGWRVHHVGPAKDDSFFADLDGGGGLRPIIRVPLDQAEGLVCTGPHDEARDRPEDYHALFQAALDRALPMLCTNPDLVVDRGAQRIICAGALAEYYAGLGGQVIQCGKPYPPIYALARQQLAAAIGRPARKVLCIGDGPRTDIVGGNREGMDTLFVANGVAASELDPTSAGLDAARLAAWAARQGIAPTYTIDRLR